MHNSGGDSTLSLRVQIFDARTLTICIPYRPPGDLMEPIVSCKLVMGYRSFSVRSLRFMQGIEKELKRDTAGTLTGIFNNGPLGRHCDDGTLIVSLKLDNLRGTINSGLFLIILHFWTSLLVQAVRWRY